MTSRLVEIQARFQQKQMQEREEKLRRLYESQQQRAFERVNRGSAGSNSSITSISTTTSSTGGKVRQMFDERRQKAGIDRSYPLEPIKKSSKTNAVCKSNGVKSTPSTKTTTSRTVLKSTAEKNIKHMKNGNELINRSVFNETVYNNNGDEETYQERVLEKDNVNNEFIKSTNDLINMMNNHNLHDTLDNEMPPHFDEPDGSLFSGKLANLGGKLPSENEVFKRSVPYSITTTSKSPATKNEAKPIIRKTIVRAAAPSTKPSVNSLSSSQRPSVSKTSLQTMNKVPSAPTPKAPSTARPSAKQAPRSAVTRDDLESCKYCSRRFAADRLQVHENICAKTGKKKRKAYDATKHRVQGTELEQYVRKGKSAAPSSKSNKSVSSKAGNWRKKHEEFIAAIKAAKMAQAHVAKGGKLSDLPPPPPSSNPDYIQCPHCGRRFNETAAERHIPKCATYLHNKPKPAAAKPPAFRR